MKERTIEQRAWLPDFLMSSVIFPGSMPKMGDELRDELDHAIEARVGYTIDDMTALLGLLTAVEETDAIIIRMISQS